jgi:hypothetical protein
LEFAKNTKKLEINTNFSEQNKEESQVK